MTSTRNGALGFEATGRKMYRLVFHNGSLSVTGPQKSIKVWYSTAQGMPSKLAESHEVCGPRLEELEDRDLYRIGTAILERGVRD